MLIDIFMIAVFCAMLMAAAVFIKKMPSHEVVKTQNNPQDKP
ncbi:MAG: hypothetical protein QX197_10695 [Methylococcaceae bacterium]